MKPRLVGAVIIVAVALVVLPLLFQNPVKYPDVPDFVIPPEPVMPKHVPVETPKEYARLKKRMGELAPKEAVDEQRIETPAEQKKLVTKPNRKEPFELDQSGLPVAWAVQLATFKEYDNAAALRDKLRGAGYNVYTRRISSSAGDKIQILVGPVLGEKKIKALRKKLHDRYELDGLVIRYLK
ncbi:MAG: SPOR domain-containing protein [Pseudomonadales bacterium]|nr:SPOR domain-containing protein [Pseudomonadales bacterium]